MRSVVDTAWGQLSDRPLPDVEPSAHLGEMLEAHRKWVDRNVVAACRVCNDRKGSTAVGDFLRLLYRQGYLAEGELEKRLEGVRLLQAGEIKPHIPR